MKSRHLALPALALAAVVGVLGVQISQGGGSFEPLHPPGACADRTVTPQAEGLEGLTERLVLTGLADAACTLGVSREQLTLDIAQASGSATDKQVDALRQGLLSAVDEMVSDGSLPQASDLLDEALTNADLNTYVERAIRALPDRVVNSIVKIDDVLDRAIAALDLRELLTNLDDQAELEDQVNDALTQAVKDSIIARLKDLLPDLPNLP